LCPPPILEVFISILFISCFSSNPHEIASGVIYIIGFRSR
jgi:hypothetical protein